MNFVKNKIELRKSTIEAEFVRKSTIEAEFVRKGTMEAEFSSARRHLKLNNSAKAH